MNILKFEFTEDNFINFVRLFNDEGCNFLPYPNLVKKYKDLMEPAEHPFAYVWRFDEKLIKKLTPEGKQLLVNELLEEYFNSK